MNKKIYLLVDSNNCFFRAINVVNTSTQIWDRIGIALDITLSGLKNMNLKFNPDHVVFMTEGKTWRKEYEPRYKISREIKKLQMTDIEREEFEMLFEMMNDFFSFVEEKTNASMLKHDKLEGDDLIARWIQRHPEDEHIILSTDSDFRQLIADNVKQYNPVEKRLYTLNNVFEEDCITPATNKKGELIEVVDPEYSLFLKIIRGDKGDDVLSCYPGITVKSSKKRVGINEAFEDRHNKGYAWNTFMNSTWKNHLDLEIRVADAFEHNKTLIDLSHQPPEIKELMDEYLDTVEEKSKSLIGIQFLKFIKKYELNNIAKYPNDYINIFTKGYKK